MSRSLCLTRHCLGMITRIECEVRPLAGEPKTPRTAVRIRETPQETAIGVFTRLMTQLDFYRVPVLPGAKGRER